GIQQRLLVEQVIAGIGGEPELREYRQQHLLARRLAHQPERPVEVVLRVAYAHQRRSDGQPDEAVAVGVEEVLHGAILRLALYGGISHRCSSRKPWSCRTRSSAWRWTTAAAIAWPTASWWCMRTAAGESVAAPCLTKCARSS